ncbi:MAG TPA: hypothetical protein VHP62_01825 [Usitatibacter sp.]|jgi:hypothetical protein|nr:hypothetical protein [Usitatibacter sp.]
MSDTPPVAAILPGDVLLYAGTGANDWVISIKTWSKVTHCELALSTTESAASRPGLGVHTYPLRVDDLTHILRPNKTLDMVGVKTFHQQCLGQAYDWWGLMRFYTLGEQSLDKQFCSEYLTRLLRHGGFEPFQAEDDADLVAPGTFLYSSCLLRVWSQS